MLRKGLCAAMQEHVRGVDSEATHRLHHLATVQSIGSWSDAHNGCVWDPKRDLSGEVADLPVGRTLGPFGAAALLRMLVYNTAQEVGGAGTPAGGPQTS